MWTGPRFSLSITHGGPLDGCHSPAMTKAITLSVAVGIPYGDSVFILLAKHSGAGLWNHMAILVLINVGPPAPTLILVRGHCDPILQEHRRDSATF